MSKTRTSHIGTNSNSGGIRMMSMLDTDPYIPCIFHNSSIQKKMTSTMKKMRDNCMSI